MVFCGFCAHVFCAFDHHWLAQRLMEYGFFRFASVLRSKLGRCRFVVACRCDDVHEFVVEYLYLLNGDGSIWQWRQGGGVDSPGALSVSGAEAGSGKVCVDPLGEKIETALAEALNRRIGSETPAHLGQAIKAAVFPGGKRVRPRLCMMVFQACGGNYPALAESAAVAIELLHCASLIHDDLPCFDNAALRRGKPTLHRAFGEPTALLAGDALIVLAISQLSRQAEEAPALAMRMTELMADSAGPGRGLIAGQAMESLPQVPIELYHRSKTGCLFATAAACGALAGGSEPAPWEGVGEWLGQAFQIADDIADVVGTPEALGKPVGQDMALARPNIAHRRGLDAAVEAFRGCVERLGDIVPPCQGRDGLVQWLSQCLTGLAGPAAGYVDAAGHRAVAHA